MAFNKSSAQRNELVDDYHYIVRDIARRLAKRFHLPGNMTEELEAAGYLGLVEAAGRFKEEYGESFKGYLYIRIRGAMLDNLRASTVLSSKAHRFMKAMRAVQFLREEDIAEQAVFHSNGSSPDRNLARILDIAGKGALAFRLSMEEAEQELDECPCELTPADARLEQHEKRQQLLTYVDQLPTKERHVIRAYYFEDRTFSEIAADTRMNKSWISRLHSRALDRLKELMYAG